MSTNQTDNPNTEPAEKAARSDRPKRRRRRRGMQPGLSLLAQGQPMVWLTGGALVICLVMVFGLLGLVVYYGSRSFWPRELVQVELRDGNVFLGEVTEDEEYNVTKQMVQDLPPAIRDHALEKMGEDRLQMPSSRRQFRTGNFKITGKHTNWVSDFELQPQHESRPEWAVVVERLEWGRFYGEPKDFAIRHERPIPDEEQQLLAIVQFLEAGAVRLPADQQVPVLDAAKPIRADYEKLRQQNVAMFLKKFSATDEKRLDAVLDDDQVIPVDGVEDGHNVVEVHEVWMGAAGAWAKFEEFHEVVRDRFRQRESLQRHDIGKLNNVESDAWLEMRQAELDLRDFDPNTGRRIQTVFVVNAAEEVLTAELEVEALRKDGKKNKQTVAEIKRRFGADSEIAKSAEQIDAALDAQIEELVKKPAARSAKLRAHVDETDQRARDAVAAYWQSKQETSLDRAAIKVQMDALEYENARYELRMITTSREPLYNAAVESADGMTSAGLPTALNEAFELNGHALGKDIEVTGDDELGRWKVVDRSDASRAKTFYAKWSDGQFSVAKAVEQTLSLGQIVRAYPANRLSFGDKIGVYFSRWKEFLWDNPREANSAGGVFPAIWGTVAMTIIMSLFVVPFGVLAALYLREYAKAGPIVSAVRISINNLAGVPSIVFGVFGFGFFVIKMGAFMDGGPNNAEIHPWPPATWFGWLLIMVVVAVAAFFCGALSWMKRRGQTSKLRRVFGTFSILLWIVTTVLVILVVFKTPYFSGFYEAEMTKNPVFGKGGLLWASLTLALLTLPVVIVATEEALSAVPNSLREGSYACGASKWQTIRRVVLPHAMPGIMTGMILAMARGAGEVAPLMLVGAKKLTDKLPVDGDFPFVHMDRSFMHLGFHIYDVGFQSQDSEGSKPLVFTTTLLLIFIIAFLNLTAIWLRSRLRKRFQAAHF